MLYGYARVSSREQNEERQMIAAKLFCGGLRKMVDYVEFSQRPQRPSGSVVSIKDVGISRKF